MKIILPCDIFQPGHVWASWGHSADVWVRVHLNIMHMVGRERKPRATACVGQKRSKVRDRLQK